jgi:Raf kinase inhibitor-like YbhB/YbcL family protein
MPREPIMHRFYCRFAASLLALFQILACGCDPKADPGRPATAPPPQAQAEGTPPATQTKEKTMQLIGPFSDGAVIDKQYSGEGPDRSPALQWSGAPAGTQSFLVICDDPDAPSPRRPAKTPWVHWVIYNIPPQSTSLPEGLPRDAQPQEMPGATQGWNSWDRDNVGYRGPMPPPGSGAHRYFFRIYALDTQLNVAPDLATKDAVLQAASGHILAEGQLVGKYER